jgi:GntR family transcriptional regulator, transcriptional repressor for pyruvate dehydrogenase complex
VDSRVSIPVSVAARIEELIASRAMEAGSRLPSERELSSLFGVARTSVREALSLLIAARVLRSEPGRGTYIRGKEAFSATDQHKPAAPGGFESVIDASNYSKLDVSRFRKMIEGQSARLAAMRISDDNILQLERNLSQFKSQTRAMEMEASATTDFEFHRLIIEFSGVKLFADLHLACRELVMGAVRIPRAQLNRAWEPVVEHERVVEALKRRDPDEARYYMESHIIRSADRHGIILADDVV